MQDKRTSLYVYKVERKYAVLDYFVTDTENAVPGEVWHVLDDNSLIRIIGKVTEFLMTLYK